MAAGQGFKTFATGDVLTAADTNGYLMQGVLVFANATARDAAITSPQEGQTCYLKDTDQILCYSGSAWVVKSGASPLTTKGDLFGYSTTDARIAVGADGTILTADSTQSTGVKWATPSSGAITWTPRKGPSGAMISDFAWNESNLYVAVGDSGSLFSSSDAITWTSRTSGFGANEINSVAYGNGIFVAVGVNGTITTSTDGITWTARTSGVSTNTLRRVKYLNSLFIAVGEGANGGTGGITTSTDGITWTKRTTPTTSATSLRDVAYGNGYYVAIGQNNTKNGYYSTDGSSWTVLGTGASNNATAVIYYGGNWIYFQPNGSTSIYYTSTNPTGTWSSMIYSNGSVAYSSNSQYSTYNGTMWYRDYVNTNWIYKINLTATNPAYGFDSIYQPIQVPAAMSETTTAAYVSPYSPLRGIYVKSDGGILIGDFSGRIWTSF